MISLDAERGESSSARLLMPKLISLAFTAVALVALAAPAQENGARDILFANPLVRWSGTVHKRGAGDLWVFYSGSDDIRVVVPKGTTPEGFLAAKRAAHDAVISWLEAQSKPDYAPSRGPDEMPASSQMQAFADKKNKILGRMFSYRALGTSKTSGATYWRFYIKGKVAGYPDVVVRTPEGISPDVFDGLHFAAMGAVADYAARHPEEAVRTK
jgi:hypothetical protein